MDASMPAQIVRLGHGWAVSGQEDVWETWPRCTPCLPERRQDWHFRTSSGVCTQPDHTAASARFALEQLYLRRLSETRQGI